MAVDCTINCEVPEITPPEFTPDGSLTDWLTTQLMSFGLTLWDILTDILLLIVDLFMGLALCIVEANAAVFELVSVGSYMAGLPPQVISIILQIGIPECLTMIATAAAARLMMQLIPFVRLGS